MVWCLFKQNFRKRRFDSVVRNYNFGCSCIWLLAELNPEEANKLRKKVEVPTKLVNSKRKADKLGSESPEEDGRANNKPVVLNPQGMEGRNLIVPLIAKVPVRLREKIWDFTHVDFVLLIPEIKKPTPPRPSPPKTPLHGSVVACTLPALLSSAPLVEGVPASHQRPPVKHSSCKAPHLIAPAPVGKNAPLMSSFVPPPQAASPLMLNQSVAAPIQCPLVPPFQLPPVPAPLLLLAGLPTPVNREIWIFWVDKAMYNSRPPIEASRFA